MSYSTSSPERAITPNRAADDTFGASPFNAMLVWGSFLAGFFIPLTPFIGVVFAYINRRNADPVLATHYSAAISTFWITLIVGFIGGILTWVLIGFPILWLLAIWTVWRSIRGMMKVSAGRPM